MMTTKTTSKPPPPTPTTQQRLPLKPLRLHLRPLPVAAAAAAASSASASAVSTPASTPIEEEASVVARRFPSKKPLPLFSPDAASELRSSLRRLLGAASSTNPESSSPPYASCSLLVPTEYEFSRTQERAFVELDSAMTRCAARYLLLALASAAAAAIGGGGGGSHHSPNSHLQPCPHTWIARAEAAQALAVSVFLWAAGEPFARIAETRGSDLQHLLDGLSETAHALLEATIMSAGLCLLFAASAAALWPRGAFPAIAAMTFAATAARATLHR